MSCIHHSHTVCVALPTVAAFARKVILKIGAP
jgi:hypothetical protein